MEKIYFAHYPNEEQLVRYQVLMPNYVRYNPRETKKVKATLEELSDTLGLKLEDRHKMRRDEVGAVKAVRENLDYAGPYFHLFGTTKKEEFERVFDTEIDSVEFEKQYWDGDEFGASPTKYWMKIQEWKISKSTLIPNSINLKVHSIAITNHFGLLQHEEGELSFQERLLDRYIKQGKKLITLSL